jgi:hypothetical protein
VCVTSCPYPFAVSGEHLHFRRTYEHKQTKTIGKTSTGKVRVKTQKNSAQANDFLAVDEVIWLMGWPRSFYPCGTDVLIHWDQNGIAERGYIMSTQTFWKVVKVIFWFHFISLVLGITLAVIVGP